MAEEEIFYTGILARLQVRFEVTSPEGELVEIGFFMSNLVEAKIDEFRRELAELVASASETEPKITETPIPYGGSALGQAGHDIAIGVVSNGIFALLWALVTKYYPKQRRYPPTPEEIEMAALTAQELNKFALRAIEQRYGIPADELTEIGTGLDGVKGQCTYQAKDGTVFIVNVDANPETPFSLRTLRIPPKTAE